MYKENLFHVIDLYKDVFGKHPVVLKFTESEKYNGNSDITDMTQYNSGAQQTRQGVSIYDKNHKLSFGRDYYMPVKLNGMIIPHAVMSINGKKTIVETPMINRQGAIKELISIDDYTMKLSGLLISDINEFPDDLIIKLKNLYELQQSVILESPLTAIFLTKTDRVIIKDISIPETRGNKGVKPFELNLVTDMPFTLIEE